MLRDKIHTYVIEISNIRKLVNIFDLDSIEFLQMNI